jgi:flagellar basal body P-ring formation protein FlgA
MNRLVASILCAAALATAAPAFGQTLRPAVTVESSVLHLGDLFANAGDRATDSIAPAPPAGMRITYGSDWLAAVAREHGLDWTPSSPFDQVTIERASRDIGSDAIAEQLMNEIAAREPVTDAELELDNPSLHLVVPADASASLAIDGLEIDRRSGRVTAIVSAPAGDPAATRQRVSGHLVFHVAVPVLNHAIAAGATIAAEDLGTITLRRDRLGTDVATDPQQIVGMSPRRPLPTGEPIRLGDLERPVLVHKGELVTILLATANLQLTAQGKALEDGAKDALVHIANTKSDRVIDATVVAAGTVSATMPGDAAQRTAER